MKKKVKKLELSKETVRNLEGLQGVHGGTYETFGCISRINNCFNTQQYSCRC
jgi:hypothetical protein